MPSDLLTEWMAYFELEPFGPARADLRAGLVAAVVANTAFGRKKGGTSLKPSDFFENLKDEEPDAEPMTDEAMERQLLALTKSMGGVVLGRGRKTAAKQGPKTPPACGARKGK